MTETRNTKSIHELIAEGEMGRFHAALKMVHASYAANSDELAAETILTNELTAIGLNVQRLEGGGNNKNYHVTNPSHPDEDVVIQICRKTAEAEAAFSAVTSGGKSSWQAETFDDVNGHPTDGSNETDVIHVTVMEFCPGSLQKIIKKNPDDAERINVAIDVGSQLSQELTFFAKKGVICTDLKPGNILMREDNHIVTADTKGIIDPTGLPVRKNGTILMGDLTREYLSEDFQMNWQLNTTQETVLNVWNKEYSYQLAATLYYIATGKERHSYSPWQEEQRNKLMNSNEPVFDFNHPIFKTEQGGKLQVVIENLGAKDSKQRFRHADAVECLKVLDNPVEFAKQIDIARKNAPKGAALVESMSTEKAMKFMKGMKDIEQAQAKFTAAKAEERVDKKEQGVRGKIKSAFNTIREKAESVKKAVKPEEKSKENVADENQNNITRPRMK